MSMTLREDGSKAPRTRGRRPRLTHAMIIEKAVELLRETAAEDFTLARLAKPLGISVMALYTYFPSRDALLDAVAENIFSIFSPPPSKPRWQDEIHDWLWALQRHLQDYPIALKLLGWEAHISAAWVRAWLPIVRLIEAQGLQGERLAFAISWFLHASIGTINAYGGGSSFQSADSFAEMAGLDPEDHRLAVSYGTAVRNIRPEDSLEFAFRQIVRGVEQLVREEAGENGHGRA